MIATAKPTIRKAGLILASIAAIAAMIPTAASAHAQTVICVHDGHYVTVKATGTACGTAMTIERYWGGHEILTRTVKIAGTGWTMKINRNAGTIWAYGQWLPIYATTFTAGGHSVEIDSLPYG